MGKSEVNSQRADSNGSTNYLTKSPLEASKMLEAALLQMDGILSGNFKNLILFITILNFQTLFLYFMFLTNIYMQIYSCKLKILNIYSHLKSFIISVNFNH